MYLMKQYIIHNIIYKMDRSIGIQIEGLNSSYVINKQGKDKTSETTVQY